MTPYVARYLTPEDLRLFEKIRQLVQELPDNLDLGIDDGGRQVVLSCHVLVRALANVLGLQYVDGYFSSRYDHSWLLTPSGHIIDPYPVAIWGGPFMIDGGSASPARVLYRRTSARRISNQRFARPWFRRAVRRATAALRRLADGSGNS